MLLTEEAQLFLARFWLVLAILFDVIGVYSFVKIWQNSDDFVVKSRYFSVLALQLVAMIIIVTLALFFSDVFKICSA